MAVIDLAQPATLAADGAGPHLWLIVIGAVLVLAILLAFVLGQRREDREPPPVDPRLAGRARPWRRDPPD
ncbi:hypothetical protein [Kitasatospora sp. NPDC094015]|uniref:DUF6479 family protein n=1 Tax=Kitasatospora sp. NPDC094015 TaxID=3155205 RepID=UPI0033168AA0